MHPSLCLDEQKQAFHLAEEIDKTKDITHQVRLTKESITILSSVYYHMVMFMDAKMSQVGLDISTPLDRILCLKFYSKNLLREKEELMCVCFSLTTFAETSMRCYKHFLCIGATDIQAVSEKVSKKLGQPCDLLVMGKNASKKVNECSILLELVERRMKYLTAELEQTPQNSEQTEQDNHSARQSRITEKSENDIQISEESKTAENLEDNKSSKQSEKAKHPGDNVSSKQSETIRISEDGESRRSESTQELMREEIDVVTVSDVLDALLIEESATITSVSEVDENDSELEESFTEIESTNPRKTDKICRVFTEMAEKIEEKKLSRQKCIIM